MGSPDALRAVSRAEGPGIGVTGILSFRHSLTMRKPGSLRVGVPASETRAMDLLFWSSWMRKRA